MSRTRGHNYRRYDGDCLYELGRVKRKYSYRLDLDDIEAPDWLPDSYPNRGVVVRQFANEFRSTRKKFGSE